jgi:hypothetical protein
VDRHGAPPAGSAGGKRDLPRATVAMKSLALRNFIYVLGTIVETP